MRASASAVSAASTLEKVWSHAVTISRSARQFTRRFSVLSKRGS